MLQPDEIFAFDEDEDPAELLRALPDIRHNVSPTLGTKSSVCARSSTGSSPCRPPGRIAPL